MESWILVFRISLDVDSGFVTRDSWILRRSGGARDPAEVVRERRQRLRHRLRRRQEFVTRTLYLIQWAMVYHQVCGRAASVGGRVLLDSRRVNPGFRPAHGVLLDPGRAGGYPWILM